MSYILEALRRSQAERERGRVPGLDAQPLPADPARGARRGLPIVWVSAGLGVVLLLIALIIATWWAQPQSRGLQGGDTPQAALPSPRMPDPAAQPAPAATPGPVAEPATARAASGLATPAPAAPRSLPQVVSVPPPAARIASGPVERRERRQPEPGPPQAVAAPAAPAQAARATPQAAAQPAAATAPPRVLTLAQLSAEQRRDLPALVIGGSIWSDNAANRFVIVNGQVVREGEAAAPGVTLARIAAKSVTVRWRDLLVELPL